MHSRCILLIECVYSGENNYTHESTRTQCLPLSICQLSRRGVEKAGLRSRQGILNWQLCTPLLAIYLSYCCFLSYSRYLLAESLAAKMLPPRADRSSVTV